MMPVYAHHIQLKFSIYNDYFHWYAIVKKIPFTYICVFVCVVATMLTMCFAPNEMVFSIRCAYVSSTITPLSNCLNVI